jgi:hypothetical protein
MLNTPSAATANRVQTLAEANDSHATSPPIPPVLASNRLIIVLWGDPTVVVLPLVVCNYAGLPSSPPALQHSPVADPLDDAPHQRVGIERIKPCSLAASTTSQSDTMSSKLDFGYLRAVGKRNEREDTLETVLSQVVTSNPCAGSRLCRGGD